LNSVSALLLLASLAVAPLAMSSPATAAVSASSFMMSPPTGLKATEVSKTTIGVSWQAVPGAARYRIQYSKSPDMSNAVYLRFTATSADIRNLESNATYYFKVRVISEDGATSLSDYSGSVAAKTNAAPTLSPIQNPLKVSSYNVHCGNCSTAVERLWHNRRDTVVAQFKAEKPDVIGLQEASQGWLFDANGKQINLSQFEDLQQRLVAAGMNYKVTNVNRNNCENAATPTNCVWKDQGASQGTKVFYNADTVEMISQGSERLPYISEADNQRYVAWGIFRQKSSGKTFFFADTHIEPSSHTTAYLDLKIRQAQRIADLIKEKNTTKLPVVIVGDMNSSKYMSPSNGPYDVFTKSGYVDPLGNDYGSTYPSGKATAEKRINAEYNSFNGFTAKLNKDENVGANGKHIDYIFTSPMRFAEWKMVLNKDSSDNLVGVIPSDHNMIVGTVELPASTATVTPLATKAAQLNGSLGAIIGTEVYTKTGAYQRYERGYVLWSQASGAHVSSGGIRSAYEQAGLETGALGYPMTDEIGGLRDGGFYQMYQGGAIVWSPKTGAFVSLGAIRGAWGALGFENGRLGYPTSNQYATINGGATQDYQGGAIVWSPASGAHISEGGIRTVWAAQGFEKGQLGYPTTDELGGLKDGGVYQMYQGGAIVWSPATGAFASVGGIRTVWAAQGFENGRLGYPTSNEYATADGSITQNYQGGKIVWSPVTGARAI
jgi:endonuclease/exonuclease/phosphatase family metal-dependent hydrolase